MMRDWVVFFKVWIFVICIATPVLGGDHALNAAHLDAVSAHATSNSSSIKEKNTLNSIETQKPYSFALKDIQKQIIAIDWLKWAMTIFRVLMIIFISSMFWKIIRIAIQKHLTLLLGLNKRKGNLSKDQSPLVKTIVPIIESIAKWAITILTTLIVLSVLEFDIRPILVSFSVIGLAVSFGSQELVKDLINGILTLFDGNIAVGDHVRVGKNIGVVETISLRAIVLRHSSGELQTIPFSEAKSIINCNRGYTKAEFPVTLTPDANYEIVSGVYQTVFEQMKQNPSMAKRILHPMSAVNVKSMTTTGIVFSASVRIKPDPDRHFFEEFNRRLYVELKRMNVPFAYNPLPLDEEIV